MVKFTKESPDDMYNVGLYFQPPIFYLDVNQPVKRLHSEICGKKTSVNQINKLTNFFVEHPSYLPRGFHMLHNRFHAWRHMDDESLAETRDPRVKIAIACFNAVLRPPMLRYLPSRDWEDVWMWMNTFAKVIFDSKIPRVRSNALAPVATALRLASDRFPLHINDHAIKPVLTFWCGMAFDDTLREEIMQQHKSMTMDVLDLVQLFVNPLHFCKEWGAEELPCANKAEEHIHAEETNSLRSTAVKLVDRHAQELAIAAIRLLELYVTAAENASTKATEEYYLGAANSTMRSIHHLCCRLSFHTAYPYEASIPISMRGLALCSRYKLREATVTTVVKRAECFVSHLTYASDTPQASGLVKLALRHGLLQSLSALSPHLRWAGRQEYEKGGVQISANIIDKVLRLCILPSMVLEGPLRAAHKGLTSIDFPDASSMGAMSSTWSELYDRVRQIGPLLNDSATPCQYRQVCVCYSSPLDTSHVYP